MSTSGKAAHRCSVPGCGKSIRVWFSMCTVHWRQVPITLRSKIVAARYRTRDQRSRTQEVRTLEAAATRSVVACVKGGAV